MSMILTFVLREFIGHGFGEGHSLGRIGKWCSLVILDGPSRARDVEEVSHESTRSGDGRCSQIQSMLHEPRRAVVRSSGAPNFAEKQCRPSRAGRSLSVEARATHTWRCRSVAITELPMLLQDTGAIGLSPIPLVPVGS